MDGPIGVIGKKLKCNSCNRKSTTYEFAERLEEVSDPRKKPAMRKLYEHAMEPVFPFVMTKNSGYTIRTIEFVLKVGCAAHFDHAINIIVREYDFLLSSCFGVLITCLYLENWKDLYVKQQHRYYTYVQQGLGTLDAYRKTHEKFPTLTEYVVFFSCFCAKIDGDPDKLFYSSRFYAGTPFNPFVDQLDTSGSEMPFKSFLNEEVKKYFLRSLYNGMEERIRSITGRYITFF
jgi:hypothetical protein